MAFEAATIACGSLCGFLVLAMIAAAFTVQYGPAKVQKAGMISLCVAAAGVLVALVLTVVFLCLMVERED